ncbi:THO complex subunit 3-like [Clytia hemisphaerica]|uniref:THO complex subunit 3-like n=1 Tax=Clytia hemisphaerica TaxID=252671 RepID=UPI0034D43EBA|eukprot:TCONS_00018420-protein
MVDINSKINSYYKHMQRHFQSHGRTKDFVGHSSKVHSVGWSCGGRHLASCSFDKTVSVYTLEKERLVKECTMKGHSDSVDQLCWHPTNPNLLVSASGDKTIRVWDARNSSNSKCTDVVSTKGENINICWSPNGNTIAVGNKEDLITFIDTRTFKIMREEQFKFEVNEISWNNTNDLFFLTNGHGCVIILNYPNLKQIQTLNAHPANCICIKFDPKGKYFATGSADALVSLWDLDELCCVRCFSRLDWPVRTISFSHDGQMLASASEDLLIDIAMVETGEKIAEVPCSTPTFTVAWHPKEPILAFACDDKDKHDRDAGTIKLFGLQSSS